MTKHKKDTVDPSVLRQEFLELCTSYNGYKHFFTDGSKTTDYVGCAAIGEGYRSVKRLNENASIFTAELYGLITAVDHIVRHRYRKSVIFSDSLSSLKALNSPTSWKHPLLVQLCNTLTQALAKKIQIEFCWVPGHIGIEGNELADRAASACVDRTVDHNSIPATDYRVPLKRQIKYAWQREWDSQLQNKLHMIKPILSEWRSARHRERFYEIVLCRLRIGHTHLTHSYLLRRESEPTCDFCSEPLSILHILIVCPHFEENRRTCFSIFYREHVPFHLALLLGDEPLVPVSQVFNFLEETNILRKL